MLVFIVFFFFFQAEDGIRDLYVTGVQTCALPISRRWRQPSRRVVQAGAPMPCRRRGRTRPAPAVGCVAHLTERRRGRDADLLPGHDEAGAAVTEAVRRPGQYGVARPARLPLDRSPGG